MATTVSDVPVLQSYDQYLGDLLAAYLSETGINDLNVGSAVTSFFETVALTTARASGDAIQILKDNSVDRATSDALQRIAADENVSLISAQVATGQVTIIDQSFQKISTKVYSGKPPPNIGSTTIYVSDASLFPATGSIYIGRGTQNSEGPLAYTSITQIGAYWSITLNGSNPTTRYHNNNESVILAQGGVRVIPVNTVVKSPASGTASDILFQVTVQSFILDGETTVNNVPVAAQQIGSQGNVPAGGISQFVNPPYANLTVTNPLPYTDGRDTETDDQLRARIKLARQSIGQGTATAIENAVIGATPADGSNTVVSDSLVTAAGVTTLYIDNGSTYEETTQGVGIEDLIDSAFGGEVNFQLQCGGTQTSVAKAYLESSLVAPFALFGGENLNAIVGQFSSTHTFSASDFLSPGNATAYEITASINADNNLLYEATTAGGGTMVVIKAKAESHDSIQIGPVSGVDAAPIIGFPSNLAETLKLYKNNVLLTKDGFLAEIVGAPQAEWSNTITSGDTIIIAVDNTPSVTYTITNAQFIAEGTYATVSSSNSLQSWINVLNALIPGITASQLGTSIQITSNRGFNDDAAINVSSSSTLVSKGMFLVDDLISIGETTDYTLSRNTAQITLDTPLAVGDSLSAGILFTEGTVTGNAVTGGSVTIGSTAGVLSQSLWFVLDDVNAAIVPSNLIANTVITVSQPIANTVRYTTGLANFFNVQVGDYVIIWSYELNVNNRFEARVSAVDPSFNYFEITVTGPEYSAVVTGPQSPYIAGITFIRTNNVPERFILPAGSTATLSVITGLLNAASQGVVFTVTDNTYLAANTITKAITGAILVASVTTDMSGLGFTTGQFAKNTQSLIAFYESGYEDGQYPAFIHSYFVTAGAVANPPATYIDGVNQVVSNLDLNTLGLDPNYTVGSLEPYGTVLDTLSPAEQTFLRDFATIGPNSGFTLQDDIFIKRLRIASANGNADRYFVAEPLTFGANDKMVVVLDNDPVNKSFTMPMYRNATANSNIASSTTQFDAYDADNAPTAPFAGTGGQFPANFSFNNYKVLMQAKNVLKQTVPAVAQTAILFRAVQWDQSGERINVQFAYPSAPNAGITNITTVDSNVNVSIGLQSGAQDSTPGLLPTTRWTVTRSVDTPVVGTDRLTYTYSSGSAPTLPALVGHYVNIPTGYELNPDNTGIFLVTASSVTSFSVDRISGDGVVEIDRAGGPIIFYAADDTTAAEVVAYVAANVGLSSIITATLVNDGGTSGSGIISRSTYDGSGFAYESLFLLDGVNWIYQTDLTAVSPTPQFILKRPLQLISATGYSFFNPGEPLRFVPTDIPQVEQFSNILAVSGISNAGTVNLVEDTKRIEIATDILGSQGAVQVVGGTANIANAIVLNTSNTIDNQYTETFISQPNLLGFTSNQLVKLNATNRQNKDLLLAGDESVTVTPNSPISGSSTVVLGSSASITERRFGIPRTNEFTRGRSFKIEKQGLFTCLSWDGLNGSDPTFSKLANINYTGGDTVYVQTVGSDAQYVIIGTTNFTQVTIGDLVTISNMPDAENNGTFLVTGVSGNGHILQVANPDAVDQFSSGTFTLTANVISGDTFTVNGTILVAGTDFAVGVTAGDSAENLSRAIGLVAGVTSTYNSVPLDPVVFIESSSGPAVISIAASAAGIRVTVSGSTLTNFAFGPTDFSITIGIQEGDNFQIKPSSNISIASFAVENQGVFRVIRRFQNSVYYYNPLSIEETHTIPNDFIYSGVGAVFNATNVNNYLQLQYISGGTDPTNQSAATPVVVGDEVVLNVAQFPNNAGSWTIIGINPATSTLTLMNPSAVTEPGNPITVSGTNLQIHHNAIIATEYDATINADILSISGIYLGANNQGQWTVYKVLDKNTIVIAQIMTSATINPLAPNTPNFNIVENLPYVGYKKTAFVTTNPSAVQEGILLFDTRFQADKINSSANVTMMPTNKLDFSTVIVYGIDSYQYDLGLIAECNRIVYGDPRDELTYPGVAAAGAEIFIKPPLDRRISMSIDVMVNTGVSFINMVQRVQTSVASLVNSNPIGSPIAISAIISAVNQIPGVRAVAISSPQYDATHSTIFIGPSEKARILNLTDISVSQI